ncbi:MAG: hypothetical protein AB7S92_14860 [Parvibaculaceae bacterium]
MSKDAKDAEKPRPSGGEPDAGGEARERRDPDKPPRKPAEPKNPDVGDLRHDR